MTCFNSDAGGGGERVLWTAIQSLTVLRSSMIILYAADTVPAKEALIARVKVRSGSAFIQKLSRLIRIRNELKGPIRHSNRSVISHDTQIEVLEISRFEEIPVYDPLSTEPWIPGSVS